MLQIFYFSGRVNRAAYSSTLKTGFPWMTRYWKMQASRSLDSLYQSCYIPNKGLLCIKREEIAPQTKSSSNPLPWGYFCFLSIYLSIYPSFFGETGVWIQSFTLATQVCHTSSSCFCITWKYRKRFSPILTVINMNSSHHLTYSVWLCVLITVATFFKKSHVKDQIRDTQVL
jgi:hypothetical protein